MFHKYGLSFATWAMNFLMSSCCLAQYGFVATWAKRRSPLMSIVSVASLIVFSSGLNTCCLVGSCCALIVILASMLPAVSPKQRVLDPRNSTFTFSLADLHRRLPVTISLEEVVKSCVVVTTCGLWFPTLPDMSALSGAVASGPSAFLTDP